MVKEFRGNKKPNRGNLKNRGKPKPNWDEPPKLVCEVGKVMHPVENYILVQNELKDKVPIFGRPVYIKDKKKIGMIDDVLGPINDFMFSVNCDKDVKPESIKTGEKIFMNVEHFLPFSRFLPKKPGEKNTSHGKGGNQNRGRGNQRGRGRGGNRGSGGFRPQRGGYRPPRGKH